MKIKTLEEILKKKSSKTEFAILTNLENGDSEIYLPGTSPKGELIEAIEFKIPEKSSYQKHPNPASRYAVVGVYVAKHKDGIRVAVTGAKPCVYNDKDLSKALDNNFSTNSIAGMELKSSDMNSDIHASAEYRANLVVIQAKKAVEAC